MMRLLLAALMLAAPVVAREVRHGAISIGNPVLRMASPVSKTGAGYLVITNRGKTADRLLSVTTTAATRADLHGSFAQGNVMQMRSAAAGVPVPAGGRVVFAPGGLHVMFIGINAPLPAGRQVRARLYFQRAGRIDIAFVAQGFGRP